MDNTKIEQLRRLVDASSRTVFFGGAGVSTESGIPDFRSTGGLYQQKWKFPPEVIISHTFFVEATEEFYRFYRAKMLAPDAKPNAAHLALAKLEQSGKLAAVVTQNIDGLHQMAGSKNVLELHGSVHRNYCMKCGAFYPLSAIIASSGVPRCEKPGCGGILKPDVVLYEEGLDDSILDRATQAIEKADLFVIGGTSLVVQPASSLVRYFQGKNLVIINKSETFADSRASLVISDNIGEVFAACNF
ncbi:MAG: NAD-dependent protein deacylase [Treponema sp.]|jgi:NAD-dependent deacetylase|nr:NAD-dependent protein deacylase [Treponema sp.]